MKISDLKQENIVIGLKIRSLKNPNKIGQIVKIDHDDDQYAWVLWSGEEKAYSGFYGTDCECELVL